MKSREYYVCENFKLVLNIHETVELVALVNLRANGHLAVLGVVDVDGGSAVLRISTDKHLVAQHERTLREAWQ